METLIANLYWWHWVSFYLIIGLGIALAVAHTKEGRNPSWGWGPAIMIIFGWLVLIILVLFTNRYTKGK